VDELDGAYHRGIFFLADGLDRFVVHRQHLSGIDDLDAAVGELRFAARGLDFGFPAHEKNRGDGFVRFECLFDAVDDDRATVVATHDIHCDSHNGKSAVNDSAPLTDQAPAVTVFTW